MNILLLFICGVSTLLWMFRFQCISPSIVHILDFGIGMIVLLANGEISHITSNENFKVTVTEICFSALFRFFSTTPYTQGHNSVVNFPLSDTLFNDLAHFFTVCMFRSKPQRKKENPKGSAKKKHENWKICSFSALSTNYSEAIPFFLCNNRQFKR